MPLRAAFEELERDPVLTRAGGQFCAGFDLKVWQLARSRPQALRSQVARTSDPWGPRGYSPTQTCRRRNDAVQAVDRSGKGGAGGFDDI